MIYVMPPEIDPGWYLLLCKNLFETNGFFGVFPWALPRTDYDSGLSDLVYEPGVIHAGEIIDRRVEIDVLIIVVAYDLFERIYAGERNTGIKNVRVSQQKVYGMVGAHAVACQSDFAVALAMIAYEGCNFIDDILVVGFMSEDVVAHVPIFAKYRLIVETVDTEDLQATLFDMFPDYVKHAEIFKFMKSAAGTRKDQQRPAIVAVNLQTHFVPDIVTVP